MTLSEGISKCFLYDNIMNNIFKTKDYEKRLKSRLSNLNSQLCPLYHRQFSIEKYQFSLEKLDLTRHKLLWVLKKFQTDIKNQIDNFVFGEMLQHLFIEQIDFEGKSKKFFKEYILEFSKKIKHETVQIPSHLISKMDLRIVANNEALSRSLDCYLMEVYEFHQEIINKDSIPIKQNILNQYYVHFIYHLTNAIMFTTRDIECILIFI